MQILEKNIVSKQIKDKDFLKFLDEKQKKELLKNASLLRGKRVVHVNATAKGGGVAEILKSLIVYLRALGIESDWYSINPSVSQKFFKVTNKIHDALQGAELKIGPEEWAEYEKVNKLISKEINKTDCEILAIHDPQPLLAGSLANTGKKKIYFSHIDTSLPNKQVWQKVFPIIKTYHRIIFSNKSFVHGSLPKNKVKIFTPAIDPLSPKQKIVPQKTARLYLKKHGKIPLRGPLIVQVSRFDVWKNPVGLLRSFRIVQEHCSEAQLAFVGFREAKDNPQAEIVHEDLQSVARHSPEIFLFFNPSGKNIVEFTAMAQNGADVVVQNSVKEGFGLIVSEAMWKCQPVVGGPASGIKKQITSGKNGFVVKNSQELAEKIVFLLQNHKIKSKMGKVARETVRKKFLFPRLVLDHLKVYNRSINE